ncbi:MAG: Gfo/Idh/MocA family oxidoreductase [Chloroflexi bacterium]|nr:Gfo/Idh/MocA family oxidoreductase [Chloroflexota bacterium]
MDHVRAVLVGCGGISRAWLRAVADMEDVEIVGLVDLIEENARARAAEFALQEVAIGTDLGAMLDDLVPDAVFNCTVPEAHLPVTLEALAHGCHVLGEKPLADSMDRARQMVAAAQKAGRILAIIQNRRYDPRIRRFREVIASGIVGPLTTLHSDFFIGAHFGGFRDHMEHVLLLDMAIHTFDQARFITGADPLSVYCHEWNPPGSWYDHDASAVAVFEMTGGLVYTYRGSWCAEGLNTTWECDWRAIGQQGSLLWDGADALRGERVVASGGFRSELAPLWPSPAELPPLKPEYKSGGHAGVIREFIDCVRHGGAPETAAEDNIKSLAMVFGAIESARRGCRVEIRW